MEGNNEENQGDKFVAKFQMEAKGDGKEVAEEGQQGEWQGSVEESEDKAKGEGKTDWKDALEKLEMREGEMGEKLENVEGKQGEETVEKQGDDIKKAYKNSDGKELQSLDEWWKKFMQNELGSVEQVGGEKGEELKEKGENPDQQLDEEALKVGLEKVEDPKAEGEQLDASKAVATGPVGPSGCDNGDADLIDFSQDITICEENGDKEQQKKEQVDEQEKHEEALDNNGEAGETMKPLEMPKEAQPMEARSLFISGSGRNRQSEIIISLTESDSDDDESEEEEEEELLTKKFRSDTPEPTDESADPDSTTLGY